MQTTIKRHLASSSIFVMVLLLFAACGPLAGPDPASMEATITAKVIATITANAPTATTTSTPTNTPTATATATATSTSTPTPAVTSTPTSTGTPDIQARIPPKGAYKHDLTIDSKYDKVRDVTTVTVEQQFADLNKTPNYLYASFSFPGTTPRPPATVHIEFTSTSDTWQFLSTKSVSWLIDDTKRYTAAGNHDGTVGSGYVIETEVINIPLADFLDLANAKKVDVALASFQFSLSAKQLEGLKDFASRMNP